MLIGLPRNSDTCHILLATYNIIVNLDVKGVIGCDSVPYASISADCAFLEVDVFVPINLVDSPPNPRHVILIVGVDQELNCIQKAPIMHEVLL